MNNWFGMGAMCLSICCSALLAADDSVLLPGVVDQCTRSEDIASRGKVSTAVNPFYLRGDFDGDGRADYAVAMKGVNSGKLRVLVCTGVGRRFFLGSEGGDRAFSDMFRDNFFAPIWMVYSTAEIKAIGRFDRNEPKPLMRIRGEVIAMVWEDGVSVIYWDGKTFRWAPAQR